MNSQQPKTFDELVEQASRDRASFSVFACMRLILINYQLSIEVPDLKLIVEMESEIEYDAFKSFVCLLHNEKVIDVSELLPFL